MLSDPDIQADLMAFKVSGALPFFFTSKIYLCAVCVCVCVFVCALVSEHAYATCLGFSPMDMVLALWAVLSCLRRAGNSARVLCRSRHS